MEDVVSYDVNYLNQGFSLHYKNPGCLAERCLPYHKLNPTPQLPLWRRQNVPWTQCHHRRTLRGLLSNNFIQRCGNVAGTAKVHLPVPRPRGSASKWDASVWNYIQLLKDNAELSKISSYQYNVWLKLSHLTLQLYGKSSSLTIWFWIWHLSRTRFQVYSLRNMHTCLS